MKHLVFATLMCISALSAKAQVLTSETVKNGYETVVNMPESGYRPCVWLSCSHVRDSCSR